MLSCLLWGASKPLCYSILFCNYKYFVFATAFRTNRQLYLLVRAVNWTIHAMILVEGFLLSSTGVLLIILFEFGLSSDDVQRVRNCDGGKELHAAGLFATIFNHLVFGPITYYLTVKYGFIQQHDRAFWQQLYSIVMFLLIENGLYWVAHYLMHTRRLYWMHRLESYPRLNVGHG